MVSKRLMAIADMVTKDNVVADIGTDHAYLCVYLVENKKAFRCYAIDNKQGPLNMASFNIENSDMRYHVFPILSDGMENMPDDTQTAVFAGMGGKLICSLLKKDEKKAENLQEIILQPNTGVVEVRRFLNEIGWKIIDETVVKDGHYYTVIKVDPKSYRRLSVSDIWLGPILKEKRDKVYLSSLDLRYNKLLDIGKHRNKVQQEEFACISEYLEYVLSNP